MIKLTKQESLIDIPQGLFPNQGIIDIDLTICTATPNDLLSGKVAYSNTGLIIGKLNIQNESYLTGIVDAINGLPDLSGQDSGTLTLGSETISKLTEDQKEIATQKNWILI